MLLSNEQLEKLNETISVAQRRLADPKTSAEHKKVFQNALKNAQDHIDAHNAALKAHDQNNQPIVQHAANPAQAQYQQPKATLKPHEPIKTAEIEVQITTNRIPQQQMVVVEGKEGGDIALHLPAVSGATITITTPDGQKKKLTVGQALSRLRSLIKERLLQMQKLLTTSKCFIMAVTLYGGLCLVMNKELTMKDVYKKPVSKQTKTVFSEVAQAWKEQKK